MYVSVPWAIALCLAATLAVVVVLGIAARRGAVAAPERALAHIAHLLGGGLTGFLGIAFPPAWPFLAAVAGMLIIRAFQTRRVRDIGLLMIGFGAAWTLLLGGAVVVQVTDPAVHGPDLIGWVFFAIGLVAVGLVIALKAERRPQTGVGAPR
jgi:hypothetical protein